MNRITWIHILFALSLLYHRAHYYLVQFIVMFIAWCTTPISCYYMYITTWTLYMTSLTVVSNSPFKLTIFLGNDEDNVRLKTTWTFLLKTTWRIQLVNFTHIMSAMNSFMLVHESQTWYECYVICETGKLNSLIFAYVWRYMCGCRCYIKWWWRWLLCLDWECREGYSRAYIYCDCW